MGNQIIYKCPKCGSQEVYGSGYVVWNVAKQAWEMDDQDDFMRCTSCDHSDNDMGEWQVEALPEVQS
jgi:DNA-directed RNA polymerase subunit RPC12/RpoP